MTFPRIINSLVLLLVLLASESPFAERINVTLLVPGSETHPFWGNVVSFAQAAADDLDIQLQAEFASENTYSIRKKALQVVNKADQPDYLIAVFINGIMDEAIKKALERDIKLIILNTDIPPSLRSEIGIPRGHYKNWIAGRQYIDGNTV